MVTEMSALKEGWAALRGGSGMVGIRLTWKPDQHVLEIWHCPWLASWPWSKSPGYNLVFSSVKSGSDNGSFGGLL